MVVQLHQCHINKGEATEAQETVWRHRVSRQTAEMCGTSEGSKLNSLPILEGARLDTLQNDPTASCQLVFPRMEIVLDLRLFFKRDAVLSLGRTRLQ